MVLAELFHVLSKGRSIQGTTVVADLLYKHSENAYTVTAGKTVEQGGMQGGLPKGDSPLWVCGECRGGLTQGPLLPRREGAKLNRLKINASVETS